MVVIAEHVLFLFNTVSSGLIDRVPGAVRKAQSMLAIQQQKDRKEFRRLASGLPVRRAGFGFRIACMAWRRGRFLFYFRMVAAWRRAYAVAFTHRVLLSVLLTPIVRLV